MSILDYLTDKNKPVSFLKSLLCRLVEHKQFNNISTTKVFRNKLLLVLRVIFLPTYCRIVPKKNYVFACEPFKHKPEIISQRIKQVSKFENEKIIYLNGFTVYLDYTDFKDFLALWLRSFILSIVNFSNFNKDFSSQIFPLITFSINQYLNSKSKFYFFRYYSISSYLSAYNNYGKNYIITNEGFLYKRRYTYLPHSTIIFNSSHQKFELESYILKYQSVCKELIDGCSSIQYEILESDTKYKIGIYSSGWWARENGYTRTTQINKLKSNPDTFRNEFSIMFETLLNYINDNTENKYAIFLHPFEQELIKKHGIYPPYLKGINTDNYDIISTNQNSNRFMKYCEIGVSLFSTSIIDRWNNNFIGYMYVNDNILKSIISIDSVGPYKSFISKKLNFLNDT